MKGPRGQARSAARLAATQALYQREMEGTALPLLLHEFHRHRLGAMIGDTEYTQAEESFFDDLVKGTASRQDEIDAHITAHLGSGWSLDRLDRTMRALLRVGVYELLARHDVPTRAVINEYIDVADAFFGMKDKGFVNALLDCVANSVRNQK